MIVQAISCEVCSELVQLGRIELIRHMEEKHINLATYYCSLCLEGVDNVEDAYRHYHQMHPGSHAVKVIDNMYFYNRQMKDFVRRCFPSIAHSIQLPQIFVYCRQCHKNVRNSPDILDKHMFKHARDYYLELHPFGRGEATETQFKSDFSALFDGPDGHLYHMYILESCFPGASGPASPTPPVLGAQLPAAPLYGAGRALFEQEQFDIAEIQWENSNIQQDNTFDDTYIEDEVPNGDNEDDSVEYFNDGFVRNNFHSSPNSRDDDVSDIVYS